MSIFSSYSEVIEATGNKMDVGSALKEINQILDEVLSEEDNNYDTLTKFSIALFETTGFSEINYGSVETLSKAKDISIETIVSEGILLSEAGKVKLLEPEEYKAFDKNYKSAWYFTHALVKELNDNGNTGAATLLKQKPDLANLAYELAYRLYNICEIKKWSKHALLYNNLVTSWQDINNSLINQPTQKIEKLTFANN